jgi:hypothetical protein
MSLEWILPIVNIAVLLLIFWVSQRNRDVGFGPFDYFSDKIRFAQERSQFASGRDRVYLIWSASCGWCRKLKEDAWPRFLTRAKNSGIPVQEVEMKADMNQSEQDLLQRVGPIPGVPFIFRFKNGQLDAYEGPRTDEALMLWALGVQ